MHSICATVLAVAFVLTTQCAARLQEPSCGSYELFERLLTKMLNLEHKVDIFEATMAKWEKRNEARTVKMANSSAAMKTWASRLEAVETRLQEQSDAITTSLDAALQKHYKELQKFQEAFMTPTVVFTATHVDDKDVRAGKVIKFKTLVSNVGGGYDPGTGKLTAPHAGLYLFTVTVCSNYQKHVLVHLLAADTVIGATHKYNSVAGGTCTSISGMATLSKGDQVWVQGSDTHTGALHDDASHRWPSFSGILVHT